MAVVAKSDLISNTLGKGVGVSKKRENVFSFRIKFLDMIM